MVCRPRQSFRVALRNRSNRTAVRAGLLWSADHRNRATWSVICPARWGASPHLLPGLWLGVRDPRLGATHRVLSLAPQTPSLAGDPPAEGFALRLPARVARSPPAQTFGPRQQALRVSLVSLSLVVVPRWRRRVTRRSIRAGFAIAQSRCTLRQADAVPRLTSSARPTAPLRRGAIPRLPSWVRPGTVGACHPCSVHMLCIAVAETS